MWEIVTFIVLEDFVEGFAAFLSTLFFSSTTSGLDILLGLEPFVVTLCGLVRGSARDEARGHGG